MKSGYNLRESGTGFDIGIMHVRHGYSPRDKIGELGVGIIFPGRELVKY